MKDICEATSLSRGGLYRYFGSTKEIFIAMLQKNIDDSIYSVKKNIDNGVPAIKIFNYFLKIEKESILSAYNGLFFAIHEFAFYEKDQKHYFDNRLNTTLKIISDIFIYGQQIGEFKQFNIQVMANHVIYFLDSLKTSSSIFSINNKMLDEQFNLLKEMLYYENNSI